MPAVLRQIGCNVILILPMVLPGFTVAKQLEAMKYLKELAKDEVACAAGVVGAFTNAFFLFTTNETLKLIHKNPQAVHKLCRVSLETCKAYAKAALEIGINPTISEPMSSCTVVSPKVFREFSLPYLKELVDFIIVNLPLALKPKLWVM
ncbi:MAG: mtbA1 [Anaerospora sp.]|nr:mtbA1 [Anaerospora sp.]